MQKNKKARSAIILVTVWLLFGLSNFSIAENIPISEKELEDMGLNKIILESGMGVIVFDLSEAGDRLKADGYLTLSNTYNTSINIRCKVVTKLSIVDLDENGSYRIHKKISNDIIFEPVPDSSWIALEDDEAVVDSCSIYNFRYTVDIPIGRGNTFDNKTGYLMYVHVQKIAKGQGGVQVGIDYLYKLFFVFTGELPLERGDNYYVLIIPIGAFIGASIMLYKLKKSKKTEEDIVSDTNPVHVSKNKEGKTFKDNPSLVDNDGIRQKIDGILGGKDG